MMKRILPSVPKLVVFQCTIALVVCGKAEAGVSYLDPSGGWTYTYAGSPDANGTLVHDSFDSLDGSWDAQSDASRWDGSPIGSGNPGGAMSITEGDVTFLRIQDTGDPGDYGFGPSDYNNRRVGFAHDLADHETSSGEFDTILDDGVTISLRMRIPTSGPLDDQYPNGGGGTVAWPTGGKGYGVHGGGDAIGLSQATGPAQIGFYLTNGTEDGYSGPGLAMNSLNGTSPSEDVDAGEGTENLFSLADPTQWHEFWVTIESGGAGTHQVTVYADGSTAGTTFDVTAGSNSNAEYTAISYLKMQLSNTGFYGAQDVDFFSFKPGVIAPEAAPVPVSLTVNRVTGDMWLNNNGPGELDLRGYSITSERGALNASEANWLTITGNYDVDGNLSPEVDDNDEWTVLTDPRIDGSEDLSEYEFGGDGGTIGVGESVLLSKPGGIGAWIPSPDEDDLVVNISLAGDQNGTVISIPVIYEGNNNQKLPQSDLNHDGNVTGSDWIIFQSNSLTDLSGLSTAQRYLRGDLNNDGKNNPNDFLIFKSDYEDFNGLGSFATMLQSIPEPSSLLLLTIGGFSSLAVGGRRRRRRTHSALPSTAVPSIITAAPAHHDTDACGSNLRSSICQLRGTTFVALMIGTSFLIASSNTARGELLSYWNFNNAQEGNVSGRPGEFNTTGTEEVYNATFKTLSPASGGVFAATSLVDFSDLNGTMNSLDINASWGTFSGTTENAVGAAPAGQAFAVKGIGNNGHFITFELSTAGYEDLNLTYAARRNSTGFTDHDWSYSTDGTNFTHVATIDDIDGNWDGDPTRTIDFSSISATDNQGALYVRVTFSGATSASNSNSRIDNAQFSATSIMEPATFKALINPDTGFVVLYNGTLDPIEFDSYWLTSPAGALLATDGSWNSLDDQNYDANDSGTGESWDESGGSNATQISESYLLGSTTLAAGESVSIGKAYNTSIVDTNMTIQYHDVTVSQELSDGLVKFIVPGDMDDDGDVDDVDVPLFVQALTDRAAFEANPNATSLSADFVGDFDGNGLLDFGDIKLFSDAVNEATASAQASAVPEPATFVLIGLALMGFSARVVR